MSIRWKGGWIKIHYYKKFSIFLLKCKHAQRTTAYQSLSYFSSLFCMGSRMTRLYFFKNWCMVLAFSQLDWTHLIYDSLKKGNLMLPFFLEIFVKTHEAWWIIGLQKVPSLCLLWHRFETWLKQRLCVGMCSKHKCSWTVSFIRVDS